MIGWRFTGLHGLKDRTILYSTTFYQLQLSLSIIDTTSDFVE